MSQGLLILLRHAKAEPQSPGGGDFERPLAPRGREQARQAAAWLSARPEWPPARVLCSPARRTLETAEALRGELEATSFRAEPLIYEADPGTLLELVEMHLPQASPLLLIGHNPGLSELLSALCPGDPAAGELPTAGIALVEVAVPQRPGLGPNRVMARWTAS